jgi:hypothetical protein
MRLAHSPLAYLNALCTPNVRINGHAHPRPWGTCLFELPSGQHDLRVSFPYLFYDACPATLLVPIYPSHRTIARYEAPFFRFMNGSLTLLQVVSEGASPPAR